MEAITCREAELKSFDDTKAGVKGLVDSGITKIPRIFQHSPENRHTYSNPPNSSFTIPTIDLLDAGENCGQRKKTVEEIRVAAEKLGFFQVINHGVPLNVLEEMKEGVRNFYENEDGDVRKEYYTRDQNNPMVYNSNFDLYSGASVNWRDTFYCQMAPNPPNPEGFPAYLREIIFEYSNEVRKLGLRLFEMLSEALGLKPSRLADIGCADGLALLGHYYPACPEPELTFGTSKHADNSFFTVLLQDEVGGLQAFINDTWIDVSPVPGALVINIGDFLQLVSNDKFISMEHRVLANGKQPRISVASFITTGSAPSSRVFGPLEELLSEDEPPKYEQTTVREYRTHYFSKGLNGTSALLMFKL